jgi:hypothetical protein
VGTASGDELDARSTVTVTPWLAPDMLPKQSAAATATLPVLSSKALGPEHQSDGSGTLRGMFGNVGLLK